MERIKGWLSQNSAALIYTDINRKYLTGFDSSLGYLLVSQKKAVLLVDGRYILAAKNLVKNCEVVLLKDAKEQINDFFKCQNIKTVHVENNITVSFLNWINQAVDNAEILSLSGLSELLEQLREIKNDFEIECITKAQRIAEKAFEETLNFIKPGVSEQEIAALLEYKCKIFGSSKPSFDTIVVAGKKSAMPHGVPDDNKISNGDFVIIDFGAVYNGYHSDMTRTVAVGYATDKMVDVYNTVVKAMESARSLICDGVKCSDVDKAARNVIEQAGYGEFFTHSTGHSVGLEIHETPSLSPKCDKILKAGHVVTDEPGIYIENEFGVRVEDMIVVTKNGNKTLTMCKNSLIIL